jgi:putative Mg2+ transporter-C (MgtC) family protein
MSENSDIIVRLGAALVLGSAVGLSRALRGKAAGVRTHGLVSLGAAVATLVSVGLAGESQSRDPTTISRVLQGILVGVGFLGGGVILRDSNGQVTGLTTAATIWLCAVLGVTCGLGDWPVLLTAVGLAVIVLVLGGAIDYFAERLLKRPIQYLNEHLFKAKSSNSADAGVFQESTSDFRRG